MEEPAVAMAIPTLQRRQPYTHLQRDDAGRIVRVRYRRENDPMPEVGESEMGVFGLSREAYLEQLAAFSEQAVNESGAATGERNFLPFIPWLARRAMVVTFPASEDIEAVGVNTPEELAAIEAALLSRDQRIE